MAQWDSLRLIDGILYRVWEDSCCKREILQVVVPTVLRKQVFGFLHDSKTGGHFGSIKQSERLGKNSIDQNCEMM